MLVFSVDRLLHFVKLFSVIFSQIAYKSHESSFFSVLTTVCYDLSIILQKICVLNGYITTKLQKHHL